MVRTVFTVEELGCPHLLCHKVKVLDTFVHAEMVSHSRMHETCWLCKHGYSVHSTEGCTEQRSCLVFEVEIDGVISKSCGGSKTYNPSFKLSCY